MRGLLKHGGKRERCAKGSDFLTERQARSLLLSAYYAMQIDKPLTRMVTLRLERQGITESEAVKKLGAFLKLLNDDAKAKTKTGIAYIWNREHTDIIGHHAHIALHLPRGYTINPHKARRWIERLSGQRYIRSTMRTDPIGGRVSTAETNPALYMENLATVLGYVLKGSDNNAVKKLNLTLVRPQGRIIGKRCGHSQNIGMAARSRHGR